MFGHASLLLEAGFFLKRVKIFYLSVSKHGDLAEKRKAKGGGANARPFNMGGWEGRRGKVAGGCEVGVTKVSCQ